MASGTQPGWVYFVRCKATNLIKIGFAAGSVGNRLANLQTGSTSELILVGAIPGTRDLERELHRRFADSRFRGEWFRQTPELVVYACRNLQVFPELASPESIESSEEFRQAMDRLGVTMDRYLADIESGRVPIKQSRLP